jgi:hypothetical protein
MTLNNNTFGWSITYKINQIFFDLNDMLEFGVQPSKNTFELNEFGIGTSVPITNVCMYTFQIINSSNVIMSCRNLMKGIRLRNTLDHNRHCIYSTTTVVIL